MTVTTFTGPDTATFFCTALTFVVDDGNDGNGFKHLVVWVPGKKNENKIYFNRKPHALSSLFDQGFENKCQKIHPPSPTSLITPTPRSPQYDVMLELHEISPFNFSECKVSLFVTYDKPCKDLFALFFEKKKFSIPNFFFFFERGSTE